MSAAIKPMRGLTAIIVDDEPLAREWMKIRLNRFPEVSIVDECRNASEALLSIRDNQPDLVFLDIEMPGMSGLSMVKYLGNNCTSQIIFVTGCSDYAIDAFDVHALDFLVKPVKSSRLRNTLERARERLEYKKLWIDRERLLQAMFECSGKNKEEIEQWLHCEQETLYEYAGKLTIKNPGKSIQYVDYHAIDWIDAAGDYVCVHVDGETHILRSTMKELYQTLNPAIFQRIHRSTIVNTKKVVELISQNNGECYACLKGGPKLKVSRSYWKTLKEMV